MKSNNKITIMLLFGAILTGGAGWYLTQNYIDTEVTGYKTSFDDARQAVSVVVASKALAVGDVISAQTAQIRQIPAAYLHRDAFTPARYSLIEGRKIISPIQAGEPILKIHLNQVRIQGLSSILKEGQRAITIPVDTLSTLSGFLNPGDWIDLYITLKDGERDRTVPLVEKIQVLATGKKIDDGVPDRKKKKFNEITIGVTPVDATRIIHAQTVGDLAVLLRRPEDERSTMEDYVTIDNLIDIPQEAAPQKQRSIGWGFELIKGGTRS